MRRFFLILFLFCTSAQAQLLTGKGAELPLQVVQTPHFSVLHPPRLEPFARRVAAAAERIRSGVLGIVGNDPGRTFIVVNNETDEFNGFAVPGPYPFIRVFATFPRPTDIGAQWQDAMVALISHEFAHVAHLSTRDDLRNNLRGIFGAVPGLLEARVPPAWFVEGYAIYAESQLTTGGRVADAGIRTLRAQMARAGSFPSLFEAGVATFDEYPFGNTRYAFGAGFVAFLIKRYDEATIRRVIALFNQRLSFADAWQEVTQASLSSLWATWSAEESARAAQELVALQNTRLEAGQRLHLGSGAPAWQPDGTYAYMSGSTLKIGEQEIKLPSRPNRLSWAGKALVYSRNVVSGASTIGEVFRLENGIETQLTKNAHARDAIFNGRCIVYVRDVLDDSSIHQLCGSEDELVYAAPSGWHLFHLAPRGALTALTVWRPGGFLDIAVLRSQKLEFLTSDAAQDQFPTWLTDSELIFSSDRGGSAQLYKIKLGATQIEPLTAAAGGAYISSFSPDGRATFSSYTASGFETRIFAPKAGTAITVVKSEPKPLDNLSGLEYQVEPYIPVPSSVFWYPATTNGIGATVVGADPAGILTWQLAAGYDVLGGTGLGANFNINFVPSLDWSANFLALVDSSGWGVRLSVPRIGRGESQWTGRIGYTIRPTIGLLNGVPFAALSFNFGTNQTDPWDYPLYGWNFAANLSSSSGYSLGVSSADSVAGLPLQIALGIKSQFSSQPTFSAALQIRQSFAIQWRNEDGFLAVERITIQPFFALSWQTSVATSIGLRLLADGVFNYYVPVTFGLELSYGNGFAVRLVSMLPLEQLR